jgi:hypothetical protein
MIMMIMISTYLFISLICVTRRLPFRSNNLNFFEFCLLNFDFRFLRSS